MDCIAEKPTCSGKTITSFRFWMLQMALMDKIMSKCVALNTNDLKTVLLETSKYQYYTFINILHHQFHHTKTTPSSEEYSYNFQGLKSARFF